MSGYSGAGPGMGVNGGIGLGQAAAQSAMQGAAGSPMPMGVQGYSPLPDSAQRMNGGFGLSPQLLQMIAQLQSRTPQFSPVQSSPNAFGMPGGQPYANTQDALKARLGMSPSNNFR